MGAAAGWMQQPVLREHAPPPPAANRQARDGPVGRLPFLPACLPASLLLASLLCGEEPSALRATCVPTFMPGRQLALVLILAEV